ncbi:MAG: CBS domain-containing protein [Azonexus sp.]|nr:CBS domain-containing protein [Betaproteobacteria bacterium]MBK8917156.1 CBS domain-containing protein [Betaproteobacteria bacterium]MBP6035552.1 CBS domain-containing protein [Azonexus sp.]MBP6906214.1 CBS domain-containing protein [Azonexus sp.]
MFSIYGITGRVFTGTLEEMGRVHRLSRAQHARAIAREGEEMGVEAPLPRPTQEAVQAYRTVLPEDLERGPLIHAVQVMSRPAITVQADATAAEAWRFLRDRHIHQAPVLDAAGHLVGIVSERDLLRVIDIDGCKVIETLHRRVRDVMTSPVVAAALVTDIRRVAGAMLSGGVDGVPVVGDDGRLLGFVSRSDVLRAVINDPPLSLWR